MSNFNVKLIFNLIVNNKSLRFKIGFAPKSKSTNWNSFKMLTVFDHSFARISPEDNFAGEYKKCEDASYEEQEQANSLFLLIFIRLLFIIGHNNIKQWRLVKNRFCYIVSAFSSESARSQFDAMNIWGSLQLCI